VLGPAAGLVGQALGDVLVLVALDALALHLALQPVEERLVAGDATGLDQGGLGLHVLVGQAHAVVHGADRVAHLESDVPERVEEAAGPLGERLQLRPLRVQPVAVEEHQVDVAAGVEFTAPIAPEGDQRHLGRFAFRRGEHALDRAPEVADQHIHHGRPGPAHLEARGSTPVDDLEAVSLHLEEALVPRQLVGGLAEGRKHQLPSRALFDLGDQGIHRKIEP
jgi:hypothetical protein